MFSPTSHIDDYGIFSLLIHFANDLLFHLMPSYSSLSICFTTAFFFFNLILEDELFQLSSGSLIFLYYFQTGVNSFSFQTLFFSLLQFLFAPLSKFSFLSWNFLLMKKYLGVFMQYLNSKVVKQKRTKTWKFKHF